MKCAQGEEHNVTLKEDTANGFTGSNKILRAYLTREDDLLELSLFDFIVSNLHEKKKTKKKSNKEAEKPIDGAPDEYLREFVGPSTSPTDRVVCIHGFSFKAKERRTTTEKEEEYALGALLLFVPFSADSFTADGLKNGWPTYSAALDYARSTRGDFSLRGTKYLKNVELWWTNKFKAQRKTKRHRATQKAEAEGDVELLKALEESAARRKSQPGGYHSDDDDMIDSDPDANDDVDDLFDFGDERPAARAGRCTLSYPSFAIHCTTTYLTTP